VGRREGENCLERGWPNPSLAARGYDSASAQFLMNGDAEPVPAYLLNDARSRIARIATDQVGLSSRSRQSSGSEVPGDVHENDLLIALYE
jgi:hypothetical protein